MNNFAQISITGDWSGDPTTGISLKALNPATSFGYVTGLVDKAVKAGAGAVMLADFQGCPEHQEFQSAITWSAMSPVLRDTSRRLGPWTALNHPGVETLAYTGTWIDRIGRVEMGNHVVSGKQLDFTNPADIALAECEWFPWLCFLRAKRIGLDYAAVYPDGGKALAEAMNAHKIGVILEGTAFVNGTTPTANIRPGPIPTMGRYPDLLTNDPSDVIYCRAHEHHSVILWRTDTNRKGELLADADFKHLRARGWHLIPTVDEGTPLEWVRNVLRFNH